MIWDNDNPMLVGSKVNAKLGVGDVKLKGVEKGRPMVFVTQRIEYEIDGMKKKGPSLIEERAHVYFKVEREEEPKKPSPKCMSYPCSTQFNDSILD